MSRGFRIHENQSFTEYSEPLLSGSGTQSMSVTTLLKEGKSDLLYQYERVISATEESCIEITTSNSKRLESSDVERLQWTIHLRDCALELKKSLERADSLAQAIHKRFQENDDDSTVSTTSGINNGTIAGGGGGGRRRDRHRRNFWEQLIRHHSSVKMAQRIGEHSSFNLDSYLEYGPKRKTRRLPREEKKLCNQPLPPIICEYTSFSSNKKLKGETEDGVDGRLIDVETGIGGNWTFSELDEIFNSENRHIDCNDKESMRQHLLGNEEFAKIEEEHAKQKTQSAIQCAMIGIICLIVVIITAIKVSSDED